MALGNNADKSPTEGGSQTRDEHIAAFLEVLRESMGDNSLNDEELLEFARSDTFKDMFPDLVSGIPVLQEILNEGGKSGKTPAAVESSPVKENDRKTDSPEVTKKDIKVEKKNVIILDSDSSSSVVALSDVPKGSKSVSSSTKQSESTVKPKDISAVKVETKDTESENIKERRDSTTSTSKEKEKDEKTKHSAASSSTVVATKKDGEYYKPLTDISRKSKHWKPTYDAEYEKYRKKYNLETHVVILCDLQSFKSVFHGPDGADPTAPLFSSTVPLKHNMVLAPEKVKIIGGIENNKRSTCSRELKRKFQIKLREERKLKALKKVTTYSSSDSDEEEFKKLINAGKRKETVKRKVEKKKESSDDERSVKKRKRKKRVLGSSSSDSDAPAVSKKTKSIKEEEKSKTEKEKKREQKNKQRKKEEPVKIPSHLKWEKKPDYFVQERDDKEVVKKAEAPRKIVSVSELLAQRCAQNVPSSVKLKIPQKTAPRENFQSSGPQTSLMLSDISNHVKKVLCSDSVIEMPVMGDVRHLYDLTVQKIAWWFLKWEQDPPKVEIIHPELHDLVYRPLKDGYESDESIGHVSDPEGLHKPVFDPKAVIDPDVADEYCGFHSLDVQIRQVSDGGPPNEDRFINCFKIKPGTNYHRSTFQVKCHICNIIIHGARGLGTHIRSSAHANNFRNRSLDIAGYSEFTEDVAPEKIFKATLKTYGQGEDCQPDLPDYLLKSLNPQPNSTLISSAKVVLDESSSFFDIKEDPKLAEIKAAMENKSKWTYYLEQKWAQALEEEKKITSKYVEVREKYKKNPNEHPKYGDEWNEFWYDRYDEIEAAGQDAENHNYEAEWSAVKVGRILRILKEDTENEILAMRQKIHMDGASLSKLMYSMGVVIEPKRRTEPVTPTFMPSVTQPPAPQRFQTAPSRFPIIPVQNKAETPPVRHEPSRPNFTPPVRYEPIRPSYETPHVGYEPIRQNFETPPAIFQAMPIKVEPQHVQAPPLPANPPMPVVPPPPPRRPPSPPKLSQLSELELKIAQGKEQLKQLEALEKGGRRKSKEWKEQEPKRSRSKSRDKSRRSRSRERTRRKSRSRDRDRERRRSRSRERRRSRSRDRKRSRSLTRRNSRPLDRDRQKPGKDVRSVERGRTSTDIKKASYDNDKHKPSRASPLSDVSPERDDNSPISDKSSGVKSIPSPAVSKVSSIALDINTTTVDSFYTKLQAAQAARRNSQAERNVSDSLPRDKRLSLDVDCTPVDMELEEGEISPPLPPGTEDYSGRSHPAIPKSTFPTAAPAITNKPMKRAPPPPILSGSNSLSSVSSGGEPAAPGTAKTLLPTPNIQPVSVLTTTSRGRGAGWTNSYRGGQNNSSALDPAGRSVPVHSTSTFRGRAFRGAFRGGSHMPNYSVTNMAAPDGTFPGSPAFSNPYSYINPNLSQPVPIPNLLSIDPTSEQANTNMSQSSYSDSSMYPPSTPFTEW